jgi:hypothetical protein
MVASDGPIDPATGGSLVPVLHWDGATWTTSATFGRDDLGGVWSDAFPSNIVAIAPNDAWIVGGDSMFGAAGEYPEIDFVAHWDGTSWNRASYAGGAPARAMFGAGGYPLRVFGEEGFIAQVDSSKDRVPSSTTQLKDMWGAASNDVWAVGNGVQHWDGSSWTRRDDVSGSGTTAVSGSSAKDIWAVGPASGLHWDGATWTAVSTAKGNDVFVRTTTDAWIVGNAGSILHYDGASWTAQSSGITWALRAVWASSATDVWAAGDMGTVLHGDGTTWTKIATTTTADLQSVYGFGPSDLWIVGGDNPYGCAYTPCTYKPATTLHWDGTTWRDDHVAELTAVWGATSNDVWAATKDGYLAHYDGTRWKFIAAVLDGQASALFGFGANDVWLASGWTAWRLAP